MSAREVQTQMPDPATVTNAVECIVASSGMRMQTDWSTSERCVVRALSPRTGVGLFEVHCWCRPEEQVVGIARPGEAVAAALPPDTARAFTYRHGDRRRAQQALDAVRAEIDVNYVHLLPEGDDLAMSLCAVIEAFPDEAGSIIANAITDHVPAEVVASLVRTMERTLRRPFP